MIHAIPALDFAYDALEPFIDAQTMEIHHSKHHQAYVDNLNKAIAGTEFEELPLEDIFKNIGSAPAVVRNNGGGHYNHSLFWNLLTPFEATTENGTLVHAIVKEFGSLDTFKEQFAAAATSRFGSGWAWLILDSTGKLTLCATPYQDNPLMTDVQHQGFPVIALDVWEHAYYLAYQNRRADYINAFWNVLNWNFAEQLYLKAQALNHTF